MKKMPIEISRAVAAVGDGGMDQVVPCGQALEPLLDADQDLVLDPVRVLGGLGDVSSSTSGACRARPRSGRAPRGTIEPEQKPDRHEQPA